MAVKLARLKNARWCLVGVVLVAADHLTKLHAQSRYLLQETPGLPLEYRAGGRMLLALTSQSLPSTVSRLFQTDSGPSRLWIEATYTRNCGVMGGMLEQFPNLVRSVVFHGLSLLGLGALAYAWTRPQHPIHRAACLCLACGILGNFLDRARFAFVIDWIYVTGQLRTIPIAWPVFNLADVFIGWGIALFILKPLVVRIPFQVIPNLFKKSQAR